MWVYVLASDGSAPLFWQTKLHAFLLSLPPPDAGVDALVMSDDGDVKVTVATRPPQLGIHDASWCCLLRTCVASSPNIGVRRQGDDELLKTSAYHASHPVWA